MSLWSWWLGRSGAEPEVEPTVRPSGPGPVPLRSEPYVFECRTCGKVFELRRLRPLCPECDSPEVELLG